MWIWYCVSLWAHLLPSWLGTEERADKTDLLPRAFLFCGSWIPATSESGVAAGGPACQKQVAILWKCFQTASFLEISCIPDYGCLSSQCQVSTQTKEKDELWPYYSLPWCTALLIRLCKTNTKARQREIWGGRKETKYLAEGRHKLQNWLGCPSATDSAFQLGLSRQGVWEKS